MKWLYVVAGLVFYVKMLVLPNIVSPLSGSAIMKAITEDSGVPNAVSGIIFYNRLYDTVFEVVVFTIAIMGAQHLLANEHPLVQVRQFTDRPSVVLARLGATIAAMVGIELALRGHLSPGGGFAAGVAGGTAIGLVAITAPADWMQGIYQRWRAATWEKISVLVFIVLAGVTLAGFPWPAGQMGDLISGGSIPLLNVLVAAKVTLGSWAALLLFIRYRGLL
jgi:multicomponent Na+:H+ antiporter subunit B